MKEHKFELDLGLKVKDKITGFTGIITGRIQHITGCDQYCINPQRIKDDGEPSKSCWFDEGRLEILGKGISEEYIESKSGKGPCCDLTGIGG